MLSSVRTTIRADRGPIQNVTKRMVLTYGVQMMMISLSSLSGHPVGVRYAATKKSSWTALFLVSRLSRRYWVSLNTTSIQNPPGIRPSLGHGTDKT